MLLAEIYRQLDSTDFKILSLFERLLNKYEYIPLDIIERRIILPPRELANKLRKLHKLKVIKRSLTPFHGYRLTYLGLDCIALRDLVRKDIIAYLGDKIGMGKESEIYIAKDKEGNLLAVKFYKIGRISFQKVAKVRSYLTDERNWMIRSMVAAEREFKALKDLINHTPYVPKVRGWSKHAVVIDYIEGIELYRYKDARDPESILKRILHALRAAFINLGVIHGDLSEYNVLVEVKEEIPYIIDWPQYLYKDDPAHEMYLKRDVEYIVKFFKRKYGVNIDGDEALKYVKGVINEL